MAGFKEKKSLNPARPRTETPPETPPEPPRRTTPTPEPPRRTTPTPETPAARTERIRNFRTRAQELAQRIRDVNLRQKVSEIGRSFVARGKARFERAVERWREIREAVARKVPNLAEMYDRHIAARWARRAERAPEAEPVDPIVNMEAAVAVRQRNLPARDVFGRRIRPSRANEAARQAEVAEIVRTKRSSGRQEAYLRAEYGPEMRLPRELASQIPAMHPECKMSISLPAYKEGSNIYKALYEYTVRQKTADGQSVNPNHFEINVFLNKPNGRASFDAATEAEVLRFQRDHPQFRINLIKHSFGFSGRPVMGEIYKTMVDTAVYRNTKRADGVNKERLILRSGGADAKEKSPLFLDSVLKAFENPRLAVYKSDSQLPKEVLDASPLLDFAYRVETGINRIWTHAQSNLGLGSYSAEVYASAKGFSKTKAIAEEVHLSGKMADQVRASRGEFETRKDLEVNALDDPRRIVWAMFHGKPMGQRYSNFGGKEAERSLREVDWNRKLVEGPLPSNMRLSSKNLSREMTEFYRRYLNSVEGGSRVVERYKRDNPSATEAQVKAKVYEVTEGMFTKLFDSMGVPRDAYTFRRKGDGGPARVEFKSAKFLEKALADGSHPSYQEFLIGLDATI